MADHTDFRSDFSSSDDTDNDDTTSSSSSSDDDIRYNIGEKKPPNKSKGKPQPKAQQKTIGNATATKPIPIKSSPVRQPEKPQPEKYKISSMLTKQQNSMASSSIYDDVALVCNEDILYIEEEKVIFLTTDKNAKIYLPKLDSESPSKTSKGSLYISRKVKIKATRLGYEHNIFSYKGNFINAGSTVYNLKGGKYVTFYAAGSIWYTMD
jgi:hypothetical protein